MTIVNEEDSKSNDLPSPLSIGDEMMMTPPDSGKSSVLEESGERPTEYVVLENKEKFSLGKYLEAELEKLLKVSKKKVLFIEECGLKATKNKSMVEINNILSQCPENVTETQKAEILARKSLLFNDLGKGGWNAFHFAIFFSHNSIVKELLQKQASLNERTAI